jgi:hypothetical protein
MGMRSNQREILIQILVAIVLSALASGIFYYIREYYLAITGLRSAIFRAIRMSWVYIVLPFWWARRKLGTSWEDFGLTTKNLAPSLLYGGLVYMIALVTFILQLSNPVFYQAWAAGYERMPRLELVVTGLLFSWMAAITDLWTRGFILMQITKHSTAMWGVFIQNGTWLIVHLYEIALLAPTLTLPGALLLTIVLGTMGDVVALKTHNIVGLAFGHVILNIGFITYVLL